MLQIFPLISFLIKYLIGWIITTYQKQLELFMINILSSSKAKSLKLGSYRGDHICRLRRRNLIASDSLPKVRCRSILTNCAHLVLNFSPFIKWAVFKVSTLFWAYKQPVYEELVMPFQEIFITRLAKCRHGCDGC